MIAFISFISTIVYFTATSLMAPSLFPITKLVSSSACVPPSSWYSSIQSVVSLPISLILTTFSSSSSSLLSISRMIFHTFHGGSFVSLLSSVWREIGEYCYLIGSNLSPSSLHFARLSPSPLFPCIDQNPQRDSDLCTCWRFLIDIAMLFSEEMRIEKNEMGSLLLSCSLSCASTSRYSSMIEERFHPSPSLPLLIRDHSSPHS